MPAPVLAAATESVCQERPGSLTIDVGDGPLEIDWGREDLLGTCAYWITQASQQPAVTDHQLGNSLSEEVAACILGGFGMPAELGIAAFERLREAGMFGQTPTDSALLSLLSEPFGFPGGRVVRYRFPRQRSQRVAAALHELARLELPEDPVEFRDALLSLPGVGPKTASWIVRNRTGTGRVAIIDVHIYRAGLSAGFFRSSWQLPRDYALCEQAFLAVARLGQVDAASLDACIWAQLHQLGPAARLLLGDEPLKPQAAR